MAEGTRYYTVEKLSKHEFEVTGMSLECTTPGCHYDGKVDSRQPGQPCPWCAKAVPPKPGLLQRRKYRVDLLALTVNGFCSCKKFDIGEHDGVKGYYRKAVEAMTPMQRVKDRRRCQHILAARNYDMDLRLLEELAALYRNGRTQE